MMPKNLSLKLAALRKRYLTENALMQYKKAEEESLMDGYQDYDLLIDNYDFDKSWMASLKFERLNNLEYLVSYYGNNKECRMIISVIKDDDNYMINGIKIVKTNRYHP